MHLRWAIRLVVTAAAALTLGGCTSRQTGDSISPERATSVIPQTDTASGPVTTRPATQPSDYPEFQLPARPTEELAAVSDLEKLNKQFTTTYARERQRVQNEMRTVVLLRFSGATLFRDGKIVETARVIPATYHNLRYCAHVPFTVFLKLRRLAGVALKPEMRAELQDYISSLERAEHQLAAAGLSDEQRDRQKRILATTRQFLRETLKSGTVSGVDLRRYARISSADVERNMREAGGAQVTGLHMQLLRWRKQLTAAEWRDVRFVVRGPQQPRGGYAATLYLAALMRDPGDGRGYVGESRRVVYREDAIGPIDPPWEKDLQLLAAIELDSAASDALFADPDRLAVDIAADGAREEIQRLDFSALEFGK